MSKITYTLYSEEKKKIVLTFCREDINDIFNDADGCIRFLSVINGEGEFCVDGVKDRCLEGDSLMFEKGRNFTIIPEENMELFIMKFSLSDFVDGGYRVFNKGDIEKFCTVLEKSADKINGVHFNGKKLLEAMFMIENEFENRNHGSDAVIKAYITLILSLAVQYYSDNFDDRGIKRSAHYKSIERTLVYINENLASKITLEELAQIANMGKTNYSIAFKNATGMTVWEYLLNARVELASSYLIENKDGFNVTEVALMCGFNNTAHFSKIFKKIKGSTPSDYKKKQENPCF